MYATKQSCLAASHRYPAALFDTVEPKREHTSMSVLVVVTKAEESYRRNLTWELTSTSTTVSISSCAFVRDCRIVSGRP